MNMYKRFKKFPFFSELEVSFIHFIANRSSIRNKAGYRASDFTDLVTTASNGRPYGCKSSAVTVINNTLREFVVRELATRFRETTRRDDTEPHNYGRPFIYTFSHSVVKAISSKLKEVEDFGTKTEEQTILRLVNYHKEYFKPLVLSELPTTPQIKQALSNSDYFTKSDDGSDSYIPTELAYIYYNRWVELVQIYNPV